MYVYNEKYRSLLPLVCMLKVNDTFPSYYTCMHDMLNRTFDVYSFQLKFSMNGIFWLKGYFHFLRTMPLNLMQNFVENSWHFIRVYPFSRIFFLLPGYHSILLYSEQICFWTFLINCGIVEYHLVELMTAISAQVQKLQIIKNSKNKWHESISSKLKYMKSFQSVYIHK